MFFVSCSMKWKFKYQYCCQLLCVCSAVGTAKLHFPCETNKWKIQVFKRRELIYSPKMPSKLLKENHDNTLRKIHTFFHFVFYFPWKQRRRNCVNLIKLIFIFAFDVELYFIFILFFWLLLLLSSVSFSLFIEIWIFHARKNFHFDLFAMKYIPIYIDRYII